MEITSIQKEVNKILEECPSTILLGYGGSHAYGTNIETSDIDIRGIYMNPIEELIGISADSEQYIPSDGDTVIYSIKKMFKLLEDCNPNTIELLGLNPDGYLYVSPAGQLILDNSSVFLSKKATYTFGNYAKSQLNRLVNKSGRARDEVEANEFRSLKKVQAYLKKRWPNIDLEVLFYDDQPHIQLNGSVDIDTFSKITSEINNVHADYKKSIRNNKAEVHNKLSKHMMHLIRLYYMGIDILEKGEINTYRAEEHDLLMDIRNCKYLEKDMVTPTWDFMNILTKLNARFELASVKSSLPERADRDKINSLMQECFALFYGVEMPKPFEI